METISDIRGIKPGIRMLFDMKNVIYDRVWLSSAKDMELYYMYRELSLGKKDALLIKEHGLRFDITVIPPRMLGCEFVKKQQVITTLLFPERKLHFLRYMKYWKVRHIISFKNRQEKA